MSERALIPSQHTLSILLSDDPYAMLLADPTEVCPTCGNNLFVDFKEKHPKLCLTCEFDRRQVTAVRMLGWNLVRKGKTVVCSHALK